MDSRALKAKNIGVLMGGLSAEREVSLESGAAIIKALCDRGFNASGIDVGLDVCQKLGSVDVAFIALHGRYGEDGCIQGLLESIRLPYTGSGVIASAMAMDKVVAKRVFEAASIPTPSWVFPATPASIAELGETIVLKPRAEGSSVGVLVTGDRQQAIAAIEASKTPLMAEKFVPGRELSVAVIGAGDRAESLGSVEIRTAVDFYDYEAKYQRDDTEYLVPAGVPESVREQMAASALAAHRALECSGATRSDFRWDEVSAPSLLEINTLPGMTSHSLLPKIADKVGINYGELVERILCDASLKA